MDKKFDADEAKRFLEKKESEEKEKREQDRILVLSRAIDALKKLFFHTDVEVYLVGSVTRPYMFHSQSDVDIVLKNFKGDRFDVWAELEKIIERNVEVIVFENCHFQEYVIKSGYKVI